MPKFKENTSPAMKRSGFKMAGYTYPGMSPIQKDELVDVGTYGGEKYYGGSTTSNYDIKWSQATVNLMNANAPKNIIEKSKNEDMKKFKASKGTYGA